MYKYLPSRWLHSPSVTTTVRCPAGLSEPSGSFYELDVFPPNLNMFSNPGDKVWSLFGIYRHSKIARPVISRLLLTSVTVLFLSCEVKIAPKPLASFSVGNNHCAVPCEIAFTNTSLRASSYHWDFGDGTTSSEINPRHTFSSARQYQVRLIARSEGGSSGATKSVNTIAAASSLEVVTSNGEYAMADSPEPAQSKVISENSKEGTTDYLKTSLKY
jgi:PKD repeat protein